MKVPLDWLAEWVDLPPLEELVERLTLAGLEIEDVLFTGPALDAVRVGHVEACARHPNADRLSVCRVDVGEAEPAEIVCGAPNVAAGQKVAVALPGTVLPDGTKIKRSKLRGVASQGMICSERELGLGEGQEGILVLPEDAPVGAPLPDVLPSGGAVLDLEITPNRGDWASMLGMAREVRAHFGGPLRLPQTEPAREDGAPAEARATVRIEDGAGCHRYVARIVEGVAVGPSPDWLRARLEAAGLRAVNNVVDVTNLVMLELGQPLHAFDLDTLRGAAVRVRAAEDGEKIETLDGQHRELRPEDLVIADEGRAIAVAGVMGGAATEVGAQTSRILLESAHFAPRRVRRTARRLGLASDASYRFERGVDPDGQARAADRAARLLAELAGGRVAPGRVEAVGDPPPLPPETIPLDPARVRRLLGAPLDAEAIRALLARIDVGCEPETRAAGGEGGEPLLRCRPPRWRGDLHLPEDLVEEVARLHGYERIEPSLPREALAGVQVPPRRALAEATRDALVACGLTEVMTFPAAPADEPDALGLEAEDPRRRSVRFVNPIQAGEPRLRTHLLPSLLRVVHTNRARQAERVAVFELGRVFLAAAGTQGDAGDEGGEKGLPIERLQAAVSLCETPEAGGLWERRDVPLFFRAKGVAERVLAALRRPARFEAGAPEPFLHPGASGVFRSDGRTLAALGELHPDVQARFGLEERVAALVLDLEAILATPARPPRYEALSRQPRVRRDLALLVDRSVPAGAVAEVIRERAGRALQSVRLFDRYAGRGVPEGKVSLAFRLVFQRSDRTLTEEEVGKAVERVVKQLGERFGAELR